MKIKYLLYAIYCLFLIRCSSSNNQHLQRKTTKDEIAIRQIHQDYVDGWLSNDEENILGLLEEDSRIQPNSMTPIEGKNNIRAFWFPEDGSTTTINQFETEIISLDVRDTLAITVHTSLLDWTYQKDTIKFGMIQHGINTTLFRKQQDKTWKIWRSMWTDIAAEQK